MRIIIPGVLALCLLAPAAAGPLKGQVQEDVRIPARSGDDPTWKDLSKPITFVAGQRACVVATGRDGPDVPTAELGLLVLDEKGKVVASDEGAYNLVAIWYPNREMTVTIRIKNPDSHPHRVWVSVK